LGNQPFLFNGILSSAQQLQDCEYQQFHHIYDINKGILGNTEAYDKEKQRNETHTSREGCELLEQRKQRK